MSLVHLKLIRMHDDVKKAVYSVQSTDFDSSGIWQLLGTLELNKISRDYCYMPTSLWTDTYGYPSGFISIEKKSNDGLGFSPWAKIISGYAKKFLEKNQYPEFYPPLFG
jgi:hypothetical protein